ncbi:MAG TPA: hypothetical protein VM711_00115, partial [Sphingomicrobium sp.]|nr:hypothetical protein [Sphingomicrobium sp.]
MSFRHCIAALLIGCAGVPAGAQDAQSLINKNLDARGGAAALAAIKNITFVGRTLYPGDFELGYKDTRARLSGTAAERVELSLQGLAIIQAYDGREGWKINPLQGRKDAEKMSADEARALADSALIEGPLLASRNDGSQVTYLGRDDFDGTLAYKLKVTQKDGDEFVYWLDPDTYLEIKIDETRRIRGAEQTNETELGDYEKVAGIYFPMSVETWPQSQPSQRSRTIIASGVANAPVAGDYFIEPGGPGPNPKAGPDKPPDQKSGDRPSGKRAGKHAVSP